MNQANPYASLLHGEDPLEVLKATPPKLGSVLEKVTPDRQVKHPAPDKWSLRDIVCHLADTEIAFAFRLRQTLAEPHHVIQPFDQDLWAAPYQKLSAGQALQTFSILREWNLALARSLPPEKFAKEATHPERGPMTFGIIIETMAGHDLNHLRQVEALGRSFPSAG